MGQFVLYKQPFPYNFVLTFPAYYLLYTEFFSWLFASHIQTNTVAPLQIILIYGYCFALMLLINLNHFDLMFNLIVLIPAFVLTYQSTKSTGLLQATIILILLSGVVYPLYLIKQTSEQVNGHYQRAMLIKASEMISSDGTYIAGVPYFYNHEQGVSGLKNLISPSLSYLETLDASLKPLLISSLYLNTLTGEEVLENFKRAPVKIIIDNYRMISLPRKFRAYLLSQYKRYDGTLFVYAPLIAHSKKSFILKFDGDYQIESAHGTVSIDHHDYMTGTTLYLQRGRHQLDAISDLRFILKPKAQQNTSTEQHIYNWLRMFKPILM